MKPLAVFEVPAPPAPVPAPSAPVAAVSLELELDELSELELSELELLELEELEPELALDTISPTSLLIEATVPPNGATSFVPLSAVWSAWTVTSSLVTVDSSAAIVDVTGVAALAFVASWVW
jgi:hypothetical protein